MRWTALLASLFVASPAFAGGVGLTTTAGFHTERVYYYNNQVENAQGSMQQTIPNYGAGVEVLLGDRDDRILGVMRGYWQQDGPQTNPADMSPPPGGLSPNDITANVRDDARNVGLVSAGLQWGIVGSPDLIQLNALGSLGSGFLTVDRTEFLFAELGAGAHYTFARNLQAYGNLMYTFRFRKGASHGATAYAGVRYLFD